MVFTGVMKHYGKMLPIIYIEKSLKNQRAKGQSVRKLSMIFNFQSFTFA